jgi:predicted nucleic acid-binding protein
MDALIFIDTNILLDFYRIRGREGGLSILERIDAHRDLIVTGDQVEMEYKNGRQKAILEWYNQAKLEAGGFQLPPILAQMTAAKSIERNQKRIKTHADKVRKRLEAVLRAPARNDPVFKVLQRLFRHRGPYNLSREKEARIPIRELAQKRFMLGYPPRKPGDTSFGDAINWEWIIQCAKDSGKNIIIVSRDSDYGVHLKGPVLNDWLAEEFKSRVSRKRKVILTNRLAEAFRLASISVTRKAEEAETELLETTRFVHSMAGDYIKSVLGNINAQSSAHLAAALGNINAQTSAQMAAILSGLRQPKIEIPELDFGSALLKLGKLGKEE